MDKNTNKNSGLGLVFGLGSLLLTLFSATVVLAVNYEAPGHSGYGISEYMEVTGNTQLALQMDTDTAIMATATISSPEGGNIQLAAKLEPAR